MPGFALHRLVSRFGVRPLLVLIALIAAFPVLTLLGLQITEDRAAVIAEARDDVRRSAILAAERQDDLLAETDRTLQVLRHVPEVAYAVPGQCEAILQPVVREHPTFTEIGVVAPDGSIACDSTAPGGDRLMVDPVWLHMAASDTGPVFAFMPGRQGANLQAMPRGVGAANVLFIGVDLDGVARSARALFGADHVTASIIDADHMTVLASLSDRAPAAGQALPDWLGTAAAKARPIASHGLVTGFAALRGSGRPQLLMLGIDMDRILVTARMRLPGQIARACAAAAAVFALVWALAWVTLGSPIRILLESASRLRAGKMADPSHWQPQELGELTRTWSAMADQVATAETERARSERLHRLLADNASDMITLVSRERGIIYISSAARDILGYTPEELLHGGLAELSHPDDRAERDVILRALWAGEQDTASFVPRMRHQDGRWINLEIKFRLVRDPLTGEASQMVTTARDITDRLQREKALHDSEARLRLLADNTIEVIMHIAPDLSRLYVSPGCKEMLGFTPEELLVEDFRTVLHPDDLPRVLEEIARLKEGEQALTMAYRRLHKDGHYMWIGNSVRRLANGEGYVMVTRDLTPAKQAEAQLQEQRRFFQAVFDNTTDALLVMRVLPEGVFAVQEINFAAARLLGMTSPAEAVGLKHWEIAAPGRSVRMQEHLQRCVQASAPVAAELDVVFGVPGPWEMIHAPMRNAAGEVEYVLASHRNVSQMRAAELATAQANRWLMMAEQIAGLGHWWMKLPDAQLTWSAEVYRIFEMDPAYPPPTAQAAIASYHPADQAAIRHGFEALIAEGTPQNFQARLIRANGEVRHLQARAVPEFAADGTIAGAFGILRDVTEQINTQVALQEARDAAEAAQRVLQELALEDALTGLANRRQFDAALAEQLRRAVRDRTPLALAMIDVDCFKQFNDRYGHVAGDDCLRTLAVTVQSCLKRAGDLAARYGGEEFAVLTPDTDLAGALTLAEDMARSIRSLRLEHAGSPHGVVTISIGVAAFQPSRQDTPASFIRMADKALYQAKAAGRDQVQSWQGAEAAVG